MIRLRPLLMIIRMIRPLVMIIMLLVMMICNEGRTSCCPGLCRPSLNTNITLSLSPAPSPSRFYLPANGPT